MLSGLMTNPSMIGAYMNDPRMQLALEVMLGLKMQKGPGGDVDMTQAAADSTADSQPQQTPAAAAARSSDGGGSAQQQQQQAANGAAKVGSWSVLLRVDGVSRK